ncbi:glycosyltransferase family 2 protein [Roseicyclus persicicus]|uniref:Glycosyltransferase family 2 protein n=1 Tax=Roseicyclus persicicus TaxID=2650661 RepID=A0A7X6JYE4_9RHOB|nr:glycosyltransferase family 2 protein [Roseibacterium persicicum]NKX44005.1 glycosyltransferase family 2 protein [Roseibacterium persicicum]
MANAFTRLTRALFARRTAAPRPPVQDWSDTPLARWLDRPERPLGGLAAEGADLFALIAGETSTEVLAAAIRRARATGDRRSEIAASERLVALTAAPDVACPLAELLFWSGRPDRAAAVLAATPRPAEAPGTWDMTAVLLAASGADPVRGRDEAVAIAGGATGGLRAALVARIVEADLRRGDTAAAQSLLDAERGAGGWRKPLALLAVRTRLVAEGPEAALALLQAEDVTAAIGDDAEAAAAIEARVRAALGRHEEVCERLFPLIAEAPWSWSLYAPAGEAAWNCDRLRDFADLLDRAAALYPARTDLLQLRCTAAADLGEFELAERLLAELRPRSEWAYHEARLALVCQRPGDGQLDAALAEAEAAGVPARVPAMVVASFAYFYGAAQVGLDRALDMIAPFADMSGEDAGYARLRLRLLIGLGRDAAAEALWQGLPPGLRREAGLEPFGLYFEQRAGRHAAARAGWTRHLARTAPVALNARSAYPDCLALKYDAAAGSPRDVFLFLTVFNGIEYIDWFLAYYRRLGVAQFFIVDNGSTDGTRERLLAEPDVSLFHAGGSFRRSGCGVFWVNHLLRRFGAGHWCLHVDMDEAFVFPHMDAGRSLRDFLDFLEAEGAEGAAGAMIDIYPADLASAAAEAAGGGDPFAASRYVDRDYSFLPCETPPYVFVQGGLRSRLTGRSLMMTKAPLIRMAPDVAYLVTNHQHTHLPLSSVRVGLLHYKFVGDIRARLAEAIDRQEHFMGARFYRALAAPVEAGAAGAGGGFLSPWSVPCEGPRTLVDLGLIASSPGWDGWNATAGA